MTRAPGGSLVIVSATAATGRLLVATTPGTSGAAIALGTATGSESCAGAGAVWDTLV